eukprot:2176364-Rhodomonas_salina.2
MPRPILKQQVVELGSWGNKQEETWKCSTACLLCMRHAMTGTDIARSGKGSGKGRNVYIPRQRLRCSIAPNGPHICCAVSRTDLCHAAPGILADSLKEGTICWGSAAQGFKDSWCELSYQLTSARLRDTDVAYGQLTPATCQEEVEAGRKKLCVSLTDGSTIMCDVLVAAGMHPFTLAVLPFTAASLALCGARAHICGACCRWRALKDPSVHSARPTQVHGRDFHLRNQSERPSAVPGRERASA